MDNEIRILTDKVLKYYPKITNNINKDELINLVISKKNNYNLTKGSFNGYFATLIKSYMMQLYNKDVDRLKLVYERNKKIKQILND